MKQLTLLIRIVPGSFGSRQAWVAHARIVLFVAVPEIVCHGLLDSSLGKLAYTSRSVVSLYSLHMKTIDECVYDNNLQTSPEGGMRIRQ